MKLRILKPSFNSGELNAGLTLREDMDRYYTGLSKLTNALLAPQGGMFNMTGTLLRKKLRHQLVLRGSAAGATTASIGTTSPFAVATIDLGTPLAVCFVDIIDAVLSSGSTAGQFFAQSSADGASWTTFGSAFDLTDAPRSRRVFSADGSVSARYWRVARVGAGDLAATLTHAGMKVWGETETLSDGRRFRFAVSDAEQYRLALTAGNIDVMRNGDLVGAIATPFTSSELAYVTVTQSFDTALLLHQDHPPYRIFHQGGDDEWDFRDQEFDYVPQHDFGNSPGGVDAVQRITIDNDDPADGDSIKLSLEGQQTDTIRFDSQAAFAENVQSALRALDNTSPDGITVAFVDLGGADRNYDVTFGGKDGKRPWPEMTPTIISGDSPFVVRQTTRGKRPGEPVMSQARGWPRSGLFYQSRLELGGFKGVPDAVVGSFNAEFFNLDDRLELPTNGFLRRMMTDTLSSIVALYAADRMLVFAVDGAFFLPEEPITPTNVAFRKITGSPGIRRGVPPVECDGAVLVVSPNGKVVNEHLYDDNRGNFAPNSVTKLCAHLLNAPAGAASLSASTDDASELYFLVNGDGTAAILNSARADKVTGWARKTMAGRILAVDAGFDGNFGIITERTANGVAERYIEDFDPSVFTECASLFGVEETESIAGEAENEFFYDFPSPSQEQLVGVYVNDRRLTYPQDYSVNLGMQSVLLDDDLEDGDSVRVVALLDELGGLERFEGVAVWAIVDGTPRDPVVVTNGFLPIAAPFAGRSVEVGLFTLAEMTLMPIKAQLPDGTMVGEMKRITTATVSVINTAELDYRANDGPWRPLVTRSVGAGLLDVPLNEAGYTGEIRIESLLGETRDGLFALRKTRPGPFHVRGIVLEVSV